MSHRLFFAILLLPMMLFAQTTLFDEVEKIGVGIDGYTLGKALSEDQKRIAKENPEQANVPGTYKFKDKDLFIVADEKSDKVVLAFRSYEMVDSNTLRGLVSDYIGEFEEPTTVTHDNIIYWFYHEDGHKITLDEFEAWRSKMNPNAMGKSLSDVLKEKAPADPKLHHLVTVKFSSSKSISSKEKYLDGTAYMMISSEPLIKANYAISR